MIYFILAFVLGLGLSMLFTPWVRKYATKWGFVDRPDGGRKSHANPIALGGGVAVLVAAAITIFVAVTLTPVLSSYLLTNETRLQRQAKGSWVERIVASAYRTILVGFPLPMLCLTCLYSLISNGFFSDIFSPDGIM